MNVGTVISARLPVLLQNFEQELKRLEKLRRQFVADYSPEKIPQLKLDDYVIGRGKHSQTFCYRIERDMDGLGRILGARADKLGIYLSQDDGYRFTSIWGQSTDEAFEHLKVAIVDLLKAADQNNLTAIRESRISPMFKGKLLHVYVPEQFAPIYSREHLRHFVSCLNLRGDFKSDAEMQQALMSFRARHPTLAGQPVALTMRFLYDSFRPPAEGDAKETISAPTVPLSTAVAGLRVLKGIPPNNKPQSDDRFPPKPGKFDEKTGRRKLIGDRGEALILEWEKTRLRVSGRSDLAKKIIHVADTDDSKGYDILSFDEDGTPRQIEVKTTTGSTLSRGFYLTANEVKASKSEPNYHLYFVFDALGNSPAIFPLKNPSLEAPDFALRPTQFHVTPKLSD